MSLLTLKHPKPVPIEVNVGLQAKISPWEFCTVANYCAKSIQTRIFFFYPDETSEKNVNI